MHRNESNVCGIQMRYRLESGWRMFLVPFVKTAESEELKENKTFFCFLVCQREGHQSDMRVA